MKGEGIDVNELVVSGESESTSTGTRTKTISVEEPPEEVAEFIFDLIEEYGKGVEIFAFARHAEEAGQLVPDGLREAYDLPEYVETISWEDLFNLNLSSFEYVGYPPRDRSGDSVTYQEGWDSSNFTGDLTGETKKVINGYHAGLLQEKFAKNEEADADNPVVEFAIRKGRESDHPEDSEDEFFDGSAYENSSRYQRLYWRSTDNSTKNVLKARKEVGEITESELAELMPEEEEETEEEEE